MRPAALEAGKVVVLTGAMRPAAFAVSDAPFNLGGAVTVAPFLPPGAHVVMHGRVFSDPARIVKDARNDTIVLHNLKYKKAQQHIYDILHNLSPFDRANCTRLTGAA